MLMGSFFAGLAFSNTRTTACHSISYPLTMMFGINHGFAAAITLFEVLKRNWNFVKEKELFLESWKAKDLEDIENWFDDVSQGKLKLSNFGIKKEDIPDIVEEATTGGRMDKNEPVIIITGIQARSCRNMHYTVSSTLRYFIITLRTVPSLMRMMTRPFCGLSRRRPFRS